jgi:Autographiviridae endonuclease VII
VSKVRKYDVPLDDPVAEAKRLAQNERQRRYYERHTERVKQSKKNSREKSKGRKATDTDVDYYMRSRYGIGLSDYNRLLVEQDGKCAACGTTDVRNGKTRFDIDHDHETGAVRGLLCGHCNRALGMLNDSADRVTALLSYILSFQNVRNDELLTDSSGV